MMDERQENPIRRTAQYARAACGLVALALAVSACVRAPLPTGYLTDHESLEPQRRPCIGVYAHRSAPPDAGRADHVVQVLPSHWDAGRMVQSAEEKELLEFLDDRFQMYIRRFAPQPVLVSGSRDLGFFVDAGANVTRVRLSITRIEKGTGIVRPFLGAFGVGATELQIEGAMEDVKTRQTLARFARRARNAGLAYGLMTPQSVSPRFCWKIAIDETAELLAHYVALQLKTPPESWDKAPPK